MLYACIEASSHFGEGEWHSLTGSTPNGVLGWFRALQIAGIGLPVIGCLIWGLIAWTDQRSIAEDHARDTVALVRQYLQRIIETETFKHRAALSRASVEPVGYLRSEGFHRFLVAVDGEAGNGYGIAVVALDGKVVASSLSFPATTRVVQRDYLQALKNETNSIFVDRVKLVASGEDAVVVVTPFVTPQFRGVIVSSMEPGRIRGFLANTALMPNESASLMREDGKLLLRKDADAPIMLPQTSPALTELAKADSGTFTTVAVSDGVERIYAYSRIGDLPLVANFGVPTSLVWEQMRQRALPVWLLMVAIGTFTVIFASLARRGALFQLESQRQKLHLAELERLAAQRDQLMREMNHRVKNNLAMINSLISIQARKGAINGRDLQLRVQALADVHDLLYQSTDNEKIDLGDLLKRACNPRTLIPDDRDIGFEANLVRGLLLSPDSASPLALAALEIVTNAVKHAFIGRDKGTISMTLEIDAEEHGLLVISDDGVGMPNEPSRRSGTGMVEAFVRQVGGTLERSQEQDDHQGTRYEIRFPIQEKADAETPA
ncbi:sensor histidine kinase [Peteryoungia ipomoeae]|nr:histidine kinase dimerization/phosphoacceptor domain -containing protein [Peteryoungia ipomoeae]